MEDFNWDLYEVKDDSVIEERTLEAESGEKPVTPSPTAVQPSAARSVSLHQESELELRMLGFYNYPRQNMNPEVEKVEEAAVLAELLDISFRDSLAEFDEDSPLVKMYDTAVLIFRDREKNLYAYFPKKKIARLTDVVYNKYKVTKTEGELKCWFHPGESFWEASFRYRHRRDRRRKPAPFEDDDE